MKGCQTWQFSCLVSKNMLLFNDFEYHSHHGNRAWWQQELREHVRATNPDDTLNCPGLCLIGSCRPWLRHSATLPWKPAMGTETGRTIEISEHIWLSAAMDNKSASVIPELRHSYHINQAWVIDYHHNHFFVVVWLTNIWFACPPVITNQSTWTRESRQPELRIVLPARRTYDVLHMKLPIR